MNEPELNKILQGDSLEVLRTIPDESIDCVITSPPYWALRNYGVEGQLGLESTFQEYINKLCDIFDEVKRVLKPTGTCWVNIGDTYSGGIPGNGGTESRRLNTPKPEDGGKAQPTFKSKMPKWGLPEKSLCQIPSRFSIEMSNRGWILRNEIIWHKPNCMPSSVEDRFTVDFEKVFFFTKNKKYYFEQQKEKAIWADDQRAGLGRIHYRGKREGQEGTGQENFVSIKDERNKRTVWKISTKGYAEAHFATFPEALIEPMVKAGCPKGGVVLDIFMGAGTTGLVAVKMDRKYLGIELNSEYIKIAEERIKPFEYNLFAK